MHLKGVYLICITVEFGLLVIARRKLVQKMLDDIVKYLYFLIKVLKYLCASAHTYRTFI